MAYSSKAQLHTSVDCGTNFFQVTFPSLSSLLKHMSLHIRDTFLYHNKLIVVQYCLYKLEPIHFYFFAYRL